MAVRTTGITSPATAYAFVDCSLLVNLILVGVDFTYVYVFVVANVESVIVAVVVVPHHRLKLTPPHIKPYSNAIDWMVQ
ncbi:hypothetical protein K456DRAFT_1742967, partial [Colletotrichum gloeosporioides 23]